MAGATVKRISQKRVSLKSQITSLRNLFNSNTPDKTNLKLRLARLRELLYAYEVLNDQLSIKYPEDYNLNEFQAIQDIFYTLAAKIEDTCAQSSTNTRPNDSNEPSANRDNIPVFGGDYEKWLEFKNVFISMIASRDDLTEVEKFLYLKSALKGEALHKISIFTPSCENYKKAWQMLEKAYEVKRLIVSKHLSAILNLTMIQKETHDNLSALVNSI